MPLKRTSTKEAMADNVQFGHELKTGSNLNENGNNNPLLKVLNRASCLVRARQMHLRGNSINPDQFLKYASDTATDLPCQREILPPKVPMKSTFPKRSQQLKPKLTVEEKTGQLPKTEPLKSEPKQSIDASKILRSSSAPKIARTVPINKMLPMSNMRKFNNKDLIKIIEDQMAAEQRQNPGTERHESSRQQEIQHAFQEEEITLTEETFKRNANTLLQVINAMNPLKCDKRPYKKFLLSILKDEKKEVIDVRHIDARCKLCREYRFIHVHEHRVVTKFGNKLMTVDPNQGLKLECSVCHKSDVGIFVSCKKCTSLTVTCGFHCHQVHSIRTHTSQNQISNITVDKHHTKVDT